MNSRLSANVGVIGLAALIGGSPLPAQPRAVPSSRQNSPVSRDRTAGPRPDPALLDGSVHPAEKRNEFGMIGDFELPGDETRSDRVAGVPGVPAAGSGDPTKLGGGGLPLPIGLPQAGASLPMPLPAGQPGAITPAAGQGAGGEEKTGQPGGETPGQPGAGGGEPVGMQVAQLGGTGGRSDQDQLGQRPRPVAIGDRAMQIPLPTGAIAGANAQQPAGSTQHHEKPTGTGGKPPVGDNTNRGSERGRVMPAGL